MRFPWAPVRSPNEVCSSPQLKARQFFIEQEYAGSGNGKTVRVPDSPYNTSNKIETRMNPAPMPGEHNEMIYRRELGLSENTIKRLYENNVI